MADDTQSKGPDWGAVTKWVVIGIVLIVLIFVLKQPLSGLVNRATNVEISSKGVKILTVQTEVGDVKYSQEKIRTEDVPKLEQNNANLKTFVSSRNYVLNWPKGKWEMDDEKLAYARNMMANYPQYSQYNVDMVCVRTTPSQSGFTPNVNVVIISSNDNQNYSITQLMGAYKQNFLNNAKIIAEQIDESTQGAILTYTAMMQGRQLYYIQRFVKSYDKIYTITATTTYDDDAETKNELLSILNSFKIIDG